MADHKEIDLVELLMPPPQKPEQLIFEDEHFRRRTLHTKLDPAIGADIISQNETKSKFVCRKAELKAIFNPAKNCFLHL